MLTEEINCLLCSEIILENETLSQLKTHFEDAHEVSIKVDFFVGLHFLADVEIDALTSRLKPRIKEFKENFTKDVENPSQFCEVKYGDNKTVLEKDMENDAKKETENDYEVEPKREELSDNNFGDLTCETPQDGFTEKEKDLGRHCKLCKITFRESKNLNSHKKLIHSEELTAFDVDLETSDLKYPCDLCEKKFYTSNSQIYHASRKHKNTETFCKLCFISFKGNSGFVLHKLKIHASEMEAFNIKFEESDLIFKCKFCEKAFYTEVSQRNHMSRKHYQQYKRNDAALTFMSNGGVGEKKRFDSDSTFCQLCRIGFKRPVFLAKHKKKIHSREMEAFDETIEERDLIYACQVCSKTFFSQNILDHHVQRKHYTHHRKKENRNLESEEISSLCQLCQVTFKRPVFLKKHKQKVHSTEMELFNTIIEERDLVYACQACSKKYYSQNILDHHMQRKHYTLHRKNETKKMDSLSPFCQLCRVAFKRSVFLKKHKKKVHYQEMDFFNKEITEEDLKHECRICENSFISQNTLDHHMKRKHDSATRKKPFSCKLCYVSLRNVSDVEKHMSNIHRDDLWILEKEIDKSMLVHNCKDCDKSFVTEKLMNYHARYQHKVAGETKSYCRLCYVDFKNGTYLKAHKVNVHKSPEEVDAFKGELKWDSLSFMCRYCDEWFLTENILKYHYTYSHKKERQEDIECEDCSKVFKWSYGRKRVIEKHMKVIHGVENFKLEQ